MHHQNCIDVKNVGNLSIPYLTRFFGSAGPIAKIQKNQNSRYVTIEFVNRYSVEKALRFEGRVLDKEPIKIRLYRTQKASSEIVSAASSNSLSSRKRDHLLNLKQAIENSGKFREQVWSMVVGQFYKQQWDESSKLASCLLVWRLAHLLMSGIKHQMKYHLNMRSNYLLFQLQFEIIARMDRKNMAISIPSSRQSYLEIKEGKGWLWFQVAYPNTEEEQSKIEAYSAENKCLQKIESHSRIVALTLRGLYSAFYLYNSTQNEAEEIINLDFEFPTSAADNFVGIVQNLGARDLVYDLLGYERPNSCLVVSEVSDYPTYFECSLRMVGCSSVAVEEKNWCDFYDAVIWKRWNQQSTDYYFHLQKKQQLEKLNLGDHTLIFEESQFSEERMCEEFKKYQRLHQGNTCKPFYFRKQQTVKASFQKLYEDQVVKIYDEVEQQSEGHEEGLFHEEVILNVYLVEVRAQGLGALNQLKLEHYLLQYIQESINGKGLIVASREMAYKLASNIIQREKEGRLFEFAHSKYERHIGEQLWRLYSKQNQRKIKNNLVHYQLGNR